MRPELETAVFGPKQTKPILEDTIQLLTETVQDASVIVLPRIPEQEKRFRVIKNVIIPKTAIPDVPVAYADLVIGAAETMLQEAFSLAVPAISCVYWDLSKPMQYLHSQIPNPTHHQNLPQEVVKIAQKMMEHKTHKLYVARAKKAVENMHDISDFIATHIKMQKTMKELKQTKQAMMAIDDEDQLFQRPSIKAFQQQAPTSIVELLNTKSS